MSTSMTDKPFLPPRWFIHAAWRIHRGLYRLTGGRFGLRVPRPDRYGLMRLETTGRRSGQARGVMLAYLEEGDNIVTLAMNGWGTPEPAWWLNLLEEPTASLDLVDGPHAVRGRAAEGEERERLWARWSDLDDKLEAYASRRDAETAVVVFEPQPA